MNTPLSARTELSRRTVLRLAGAGVAAAGLTACSSGSGSGHGHGGMGGHMSSGTTGSTADLPGAGSEFVQPSELVSENGRLEVTLEAAPYMAPWNGGTRYTLAYNGSVPGPTLRARPGDTISITLRNGLDEATNLHTHGLHVSPEGNSDNIFHMIEPGASLTYEYVLPADHPSGTFWYHPHHHGMVAAQVSGGLAGAIVIEDDLDDLPAMKATTERVLIISDPKVGADASVLAVSTAEQQNGREGDAGLVNGVYQPMLMAEAGTVERWRIVNASSSRYYRLRVSSGAMTQIASDQARFTEPVPIDSLLLTPGQRAEVLLPLTTEGLITLSTEAVARGMGMAGMGGMGGMGGDSLSPAATLMTLHAMGADAPSPALPTSLRTADEFDTIDADSTRRVTFGAMGMGNGEFVIDGKPFAGDRIDTKALLGTVEDWVITNGSMMPHPFHLHVWPFRVIERSDGSAPDPGWRDTVNVPTGQSVRIRIPFRDHGGTTVYHCHILDHEDLGMMAVIDVV